MSKKKSKSKKNNKTSQIEESQGFSLSSSEESDGGFSLSSSEGGEEVSNTDSSSVSYDEGDSDGFSLSNGGTEEEETKSDSYTNLSEPLPVQKVYEYLVAGRPNDRMSFQEFFKRNPYVYRVIGLKPLQDPSESEINRFENWTSDWIAEANKLWGSSDGEKVSDLTEAVSSLKGIISNPKQYKIELKEPLEDYQKNQLHAILKDKCNDKVVTSEEMRDIVESAKDLGLYNPELYEDTKKFIDSVIEEEGARQNTYEEDFIEKVKELDSKKLIDSEINKQELLRYFKEFKSYNDYIENKDEVVSDEELMSRMIAVLEKWNIHFVSGVDLFEKEVFEVEVKNSNIDLSVPLKNEFYYRLQAVARSYSINEDSFTSFLQSKNITKEPDVQQTFLLGRINGTPVEANSFKEIVDILHQYSSLGKDRIKQGDLNVFLEKISRDDLSHKVDKIVQDYSDDDDAILQKTCYTLLPLCSCDLGRNVNTNNIEEMAVGIENNFSYFSDSLAKVKNSNLQLWLEANGFDDMAEDIEEINDDDDLTSKETLNSIVLRLQDNIFKRDGYAFNSPDGIVNLKNEELKNKLVLELQDDESKLYIWIENEYEKLIDNVEFWNSLERFNTVTINYALELDSPFHYKNKVLKDEDKVVDMFVSNSLSDSFMTELMDDYDAVEELDFWLENYRDTNYKNVMVKYLDTVKSDKKYTKAFSAVIDNIAESILYEDFKRYFVELVPIFDYSFKNETIEKSVYENHKNSLFNYLKKNQSNYNDECIRRYLEGIVRNGTEDKDFIGKLFNNYLRDDVDKNYYENEIHPLTEKAINKNILSSDFKEKEKVFFIDKYYKEFVNADNTRRMEILNSISKLNPEDKYVKLYASGVEYGLNSLNDENKLINQKNTVRRIITYLFATIMVLLSVLCLVFIPLDTIYRVLIASLLMLLLTPVAQKIHLTSLRKRLFNRFFDNTENDSLLDCLADAISNNADSVSYEPERNIKKSIKVVKIILLVLIGLLFVPIVFFGVKNYIYFTYLLLGMILSLFYTIHYNMNIQK